MRIVAQRFDSNLGRWTHTEWRPGPGASLEWAVDRVWDFHGKAADVDAHHARARAAGAEIVRALADTGYGTREYAARDLDGHYWYFGNYRPA
jgi:uncharacterized glyoxalase superfamily protein PhnB